MINVQTGEFKFDEYRTVIYPDLTLLEFKAGDIAIETVVSESKCSGVYTFVGHLDEMSGRFQIEFGRMRLNKLRFTENVVLYNQKTIDSALAEALIKGHESYLMELKKWTDKVSLIISEQNDRQNEWLRSRIGTPPYEYNWGEIIAGIDPREGDAEILVRFKNDFGEGVELKRNFENQKRQDFRAAERPRPLNPGHLPPGFRRKE
jgi:hypothetical protein